MDSSPLSPKSKKKAMAAAPAKKLAPIARNAQVSTGPNSQTAKGRKINHKKDLIEAVRKVELTHIHNIREAQKANSAGKPVLGDTPEVVDTTTKDLASLEDGVHLNARRFNELKMTADRKQKELEKLEDELKELVAENEILEKIKSRQNTEADQIERLQKEIDTTTESTDEKLYYRKKLEHMLQRLDKNQLEFETHINGMEEALEDSRKEYEEVKMLMRQLEAGKTEAMQQLQSVQAELQRQRRHRERDMNEKAAEANNAKRMEQWRLKREQQRLEMAAQLRGDLPKEQEKKLVTELSTKEAKSEALRVANQEKSERAIALENAFLQIRQATGISSLDEMVNKFISQGANKEALEAEKAEAELRLAKVKQSKEVLVQQFAELKASGTGGVEVNRDVYDSLDNEILQAKAVLKTNKAAAERLENVLVAVRQGALGLAQRLAFLELGIDTPDDSSNGKDSSDIVASLRASEAKLTKMVELVGQQPRRNSTSYSSAVDTSDDHHNDRFRSDSVNNAGNADSWSPAGDSDEGSAPRNNLRVRPAAPGHKADGAEGGPSGSSSTVSANAGGDEIMDHDGMDDMVPTRQFLKLSSTRQYTDIIRKRENADRRQKALEKMIEEGDGKGITAMIRKKQQDDYMTDLAASPPPRGMPKGITLRSDTQEKSQAFLDQNPKLS